MREPQNQKESSSESGSSYYDSESGSDEGESSVWEDYDPKKFFEEAMHGGSAV